MKLIRTLLIFGIFLLISLDADAQCAMCRASLENNVSNGEIGIAENLNRGILYLLAMPYVLVGVVAYLWFKKSRSHEGMASSH